MAQQCEKCKCRNCIKLCCKKYAIAYGCYRCVNCLIADSLILEKLEKLEQRVDQPKRNRKRN